MDRRQKKSAGSLIIGGRLQRNIAEDNDGVLGYENDKRDITSIWGDVGYTYTFVFSNGYFWNLWGVVGIAFGEHLEQKYIAAFEILVVRRF